MLGGHQAAACSSPRLPSNATDAIDPDRINQRLFARVVTEYTNYYRCQDGQKKLKIVSGLNGAAVSHSENMAKYLVLSHQTRARGEETLQKRYKRNRVRIRAGAENITQDFLFNTGRSRYLIKDREACHFEQGGQRVPVHTYASLGQQVVKDWVESPAHRKNSLNAKYSRAGAGLAVTYTNAKPCGVIYVTQTFAD